MVNLSALEARVIGVLIEKAFATPEQYPLSLNAVVSGSNQKNNREPVMELSEDQAHDAVESLREKGLVVRVDQMGARVPKYKHQAGEKLAARSGEVAVLAELLLRGPQTLGELRGRASRMHPMETLEDARAYLRALAERPEPFVREIPGGRAPRWEQLLAEGSAAAAETEEAEPAAGPGEATLKQRVEMLEGQVRELTERLARLEGQKATGEGA